MTKERTFALNTAQRTKSTCHASLSPPGTPLGFGRLCNFLATIFFLFSPVFYLLPAFLFFWTKAALANCCSCLPKAQKSSSRETEEKESEWDGQSVGENKKRICGASANNCAGCRLKVLCRLSSFCSIPFCFVSFRFALMASHGIAILIAMQKCVCHFWNWKAAGRRAILPLLYVWAWPALLFASGILLPAFGRELRNCQPHRHIQSARQLPGQK